jgi:hypothetical protein
MIKFIKKFLKISYYTNWICLKKFNKNGDDIALSGHIQIELSLKKRTVVLINV